MYESLSSFAQTAGMLIFILAFILVLIYALQPGNRERFRRAANQPLSDDTPFDDDRHAGHKESRRGSEDEDRS